MVNIPDPVTHGWKVGDDRSLEIDWMDCQLVPNEIFLKENVSQCKWQWAMIVLLISYEQILDFSHVVNCIHLVPYKDMLCSWRIFSDFLLFWGSWGRGANWMEMGEFNVICWIYQIFSIRATIYWSSCCKFCILWEKCSRQLKFSLSLTDWEYKQNSRNFELCCLAEWP